MRNVSKKVFRVHFLLLLLYSSNIYPQRYPNTGIRVKVVPDEIIHIHFNHSLRPWHGFGVNYVEAAQTRDYNLFPQDFSGFSMTTEQTREKVMHMIFGEDGLRPGLTKMFLDPFHEGNSKSNNDNDDPLSINLEGYDHETTTKWMRYFNQEGLRLMKRWGGSFQTMVTLYGPAPWMTRQKYVLGRDLDPDESYELAEYMASWAKFLTEKAGIDVRYISFHNEGDAYYRWPRDGSNPGEDHRDYNMYWPPEQVVDFLKITRKVLDANGMQMIGLAPGETQTWYRFDQWGYAGAIVSDEEALQNLELITSHSFANLDIPNSVYYGDYRSIGQDLIHRYKPEVPVWVTSRPWTEGPDFVENLRRDIYESKANGIIPWALLAGAKQWMGSDGEYQDGSMDKAFLIKEDGSLIITDQYYYYKQVTRAGQPGMEVASVLNYDPALGAMAFKATSEENQNAFVLINKSEESKTVTIYVHHGDSETYDAVRTMNGEQYKKLGTVKLVNGAITYACPPRSVTTFFSL
jgi:O-glycosyl hydrolase